MLIPDATLEFKKSFIERGDSKAANSFFDEMYPDMKGDYSRKFDFLKHYFTFSLAKRYTTAEGKDDICREDYWFTLDYLIDEARMSGTEAVIIDK